MIDGANCPLCWLLWSFLDVLSSCLCMCDHVLTPKLCPHRMYKREETELVAGTSWLGTT